jgi:hypothetical protein
MVAQSLNGRGKQNDHSVSPLSLFQSIPIVSPNADLLHALNFSAESMLILTLQRKKKQTKTKTKLSSLSRSGVGAYRSR